VDGRTAYHWIVPAKVAGTWTWQASNQTYEVTLAQKFQELTGTATIGGRAVKLAGVKLSGDQIMLTIEDSGVIREFTGRVNGATIQGTAKVGGTDAKWTAAGKLARS
jgi:hypothetical protein